MARISWFDNVKYVLIMLVVLGHFLDPFSKIFGWFAPIFVFIYIFHMPLFVYVTGMFAQSLVTADGGYRWARIPQFIFLYLVVYSAVFTLESIAGKDVTFTPWSVSNGTWYLLAAVLWYASVPFLVLVPAAITVGLFTLAALVAGYFPVIGDTLAISRVLCFGPFFWVGFHTDRSRLVKWASSARPWLRATGAVVLVATLATMVLVPEALRLRGIFTARNPYAYLKDLASYGVVFRFGWYVTASLLIAAVLLLVPHRRAWFSTVGQRTLSIYIWHLIALRSLPLVGLYPAVKALAAQTVLAAAIPFILALVAGHLFAVKPPFGTMSEWVLKQGSRKSVRVPWLEKRDLPARSGSLARSDTSGQGE